MNLEWVRQNFPSLTDISPLSSGGQKVVYSATHPGDGHVVLKLFKPQPGSEQRAEREILAVQKITSTRIPPILEAGTIGTAFGAVLWIREPLLAGRPLNEVIATEFLTDSQILRIGLHILQALAAAETAKIVHRDVKPPNILVDQSGASWLLDFGISRHLDLSSLTPTDNIQGACTPGYGAPEQFRNMKHAIDGRADLFGLGVTLYECVERVNPFVLGARDRIEVFRRVERIPLPPIKRSFGNNGEFKDLVLALTRAKRDQRPRNVAEALVWMESICQSEGIN